MKKYFAIISLALAAMVSCNKIDELPEEVGSVSPAAEVPEGKVLVTFKADMAVPVVEGDTKSTVGDNGTVSWEEGDEIEVWYLDAENAPQHFTAFATSAGPSSDFTGAMEEGDAPTEFWAAYPKDAGELKYEESAGKFYITAGRTDGTFKAANIMAGYSTAAAASFAFKNAVGIVKLALPANGIIQHNGQDFPIKTIRLKGKETSIRSMGTVLVSQSEGTVSDFAAAGGAQSAAVDIDDNVRTAGVVYIPSFPGELTNGFAVRYYSDEGQIPAVLTKDTPVTITRGRIKPLSDLTPRIVWDYYVSATGSGDGLKAATPMSIADFEEFIGCNATSVIMCYSNRLNGTTFHFTSGTHNISSAITLPANCSETNSTTKPNGIYSEATHYTITGDDAAVLDGGGASRIFDLSKACGRTTISYLTLTNGASTLNGGLLAISNNAAMFEYCNFTNTTTSGNGGAVHADKGEVFFKECTFSGNNAAAGGAINAAGPVLIKMDGCKVLNNTATGNAGGIYVVSGKNKAVFYLNACTFIDNTATSNGYAIYINTSTADYPASLCVNNSYFYHSETLNDKSKNQSIVCNKGKTILLNSTLVGTLGSNAWGTYALGVHKNFSDPAGCLLINSIIKNKAAKYLTSTFESGGNYYAVLKHCLTRVVYSSTTTDEQKAQIVQENVATDAPITFSDFNWDGTVPEGFVKQSADAIRTELLKEEGGSAVYTMATDFLTWLESLKYTVGETEYNAFQVDINGTPRSAAAYWPGCYQN